MDHITMLVTLVVIGFSIFLAMCRWPKFGAVAWVCTICFVPVWFGLVWHGLFQAHVLVALLVVVSWLIRVRRVQINPVDVVMVIVLLLVAAEYMLHMTTLSFAFAILVERTGAYLVGRLVTQLIPAEWVYGLIAIAFSIVGILAVIEFVTSTNLFITYLPESNALFQTWGTLQPRGNIIRAEGAFGHSIALGTSLAAAIGLTLASRIRPRLRIVMVCVMLAGAVMSFSRTGMLSAVLAIILVTVLSRDRSSLAPRVRAAVLTILTVGGALGAGFVLTVFRDSDETQSSADYRTDLLALVHEMRPLGLSSVFTHSTASISSLGSFGSIDDAVLVFGLGYGWIPLVLVGLCWLAAMMTTALRRASAPTLTFVALTPALVTVAFITQYAAVVWFIAGLAVATQVSMRQRRVVPDQEAVLPHSPRTPLSP